MRKTSNKWKKNILNLKKNQLFDNGINYGIKLNQKSFESFENIQLLLLITYHDLTVEIIQKYRIVLDQNQQS